MENLIEILSSGKILMCDGAMGTSLQNLGLTTDECPEQWNISQPDKVRSVSEGFIAAGSDIVETNTFGGTVYKLERYGLGDKVEEVNVAAAQLARQAAGDEHFVFGSVGPTGQFLAPLGTEPEEKMYEAFREQVMGLAKGGVDAICIETMTALEEAAVALRAAKENTSLPVVVTFSFDKTTRGDYRTMMGVSPEQLAVQMSQAGADIVGSNCGNGIDDMVEISRQIHENTDKFVMIQANAGIPVLEDGKTVFKATPEEMASHVGELIKNGVNIIGGCCGTTPEHIRAMKQALTSNTHQS